jgi:ubiquinol-cytochrome c reductase iron-sulfur subunit
MTEETGLPASQTSLDNRPASSRPDEDPERRDFLFLLTGAFGGVAVGATIWPLVDQMNPDASTLAAGAPIDVDVSKLQPGQNIIVRWRSRPIFIVNRPQQLLAELQKAELVDRLADPNSNVMQQPDYARNWHRSIKPEFLVLVGICTHLGCIPEFYPDPSPMTPVVGWLGGYFCPCHGSKYDLAGRVFRGVPAPYNLPVPPYHFSNDATLRIGENPPGSNSNFRLESVVQM